MAKIFYNQAGEILQMETEKCIEYCEHTNGELNAMLFLQSKSFRVEDDALVSQGGSAVEINAECDDCRIMASVQSPGASLEDVRKALLILREKISL